MWSKTDDPARDWDAYCADQEAARELLPTCEQCGHKIEDDFLVDFDGTLICEDCLNKHFRKPTANYIM